MSDQVFQKRLDFVTLDVFTTERFKGNPLAVVKVPGTFALDQDKKQLIAREFNFSETVFLHECQDGTSAWKIDIFTTIAELPFAGHPTIGTLCYIGSNMESPTQELTLLTKAGPIAARYSSRTRLAEAEIPHNVKVHQATVNRLQVVESQPSLRQVIGFEQWISDNPDQPRASFPVVSIVKGMTFILVDFPNHNCLKAIQQSRFGISDIRLDVGWASSFISPYFYVEDSCGDDGIAKIEARMIHPEIGEDPATGSAACTLSAYLALQKGEPGKTYSYKIKQGIDMGRDSRIEVRVTLDESGRNVKKVLLGGAAVLVIQGTIAV